MRELPDPSPGTPLPPLISILLCWDLKDPLVEEAASGGSSPDGEEALFQLSKSEATPGEPASSPPMKGTEEGRQDQRSPCLCFRSFSFARGGVLPILSPAPGCNP